MSTFTRSLSPTDVVDAQSFAAYAQQTIGTKWPTIKERVMLQARTTQFFADNPHADWTTLVKAIAYVRASRRRLAMPWDVLYQVPWAFREGFLPELDPSNHIDEDPQVERQIEWILEQETDEWWRHALMYSVGVENRRGLVQMWKTRDPVA